MNKFEKIFNVTTLLVWWIAIFAAILGNLLVALILCVVGLLLNWAEIEYTNSLNNNR